MIFLTEQLSGVKILGTGHFVPSMTVTNEDFTKLVETSDEWIRTRTGMAVRHISDGEPTWYLGLEAARRALAAAEVSAEQIGLIVDSTVTPDFSTPATACIIQRELGAVHAMAFDVNAACTGFVCAFDLAARYLATDPSLEYVLVIANENLTKLVNYEDRSSCILFGDGAAACVLTRAAGVKYASYFMADGTGVSALYARGVQPRNAFLTGAHSVPDNLPADHTYLVQDGRAVYRFATEAMPHVVREAAARAGIAPTDIDLLVPHQANLRIIETAVKKLDFPMEKVMLNIEKYGNTSSASIPIALDEAVRGGRIKRGDTLCIAGFGAGLTMGAVLLTY